MDGKWRKRAVAAFETGVLVLLCLLVWYETRDSTTPWELWAGLALIGISLGVARRSPLISLAVASASGLMAVPDFGGRFPVWPICLMIAACYPAGKRMEGVKPALIAFTLVAAVALPVSLAGTADGLGTWVSVLITLLFAGFVPWHLGRYVQLREDLASTGWRRAEELEARQRIASEQARLRERARIASDMHDSVGHELSLIALHAAALELASDVDERHRVAAAQLRAGAASATERLRQIIGVLREDAQAPTEPVDADVRQLVERARASGMEVTSQVADADVPTAVPPMVRRAVYRVVQEGLTNVTKHAPGAAAAVRVHSADGETVVVVTNEKPPAGALPGVSSGKHGLVGLRERVRLVGGTLAAGVSDGGFEVRARLPHDASPSAEAPETEAERSESARELAHVRRKARYTLIHALAAPALVVIVGVVIGATQYTYNWSSSRLDPAQYEQFRIGQSRADIQGSLPRKQTIERSGEEQAQPPGSLCEYYRTDRGLLEFSGESFRLCFAGGVLVSKEVVPDQRGER